MYLVDTNVVSAGTPTKARPTPGPIAWMERNSERLYLSAITVAEVEDGIAKARRQGATRKADRLAEWLETLLHLYGPRICRSTSSSPGCWGRCPTGPVAPARHPASPIWRLRRPLRAVDIRC